ncbi:hypothetical protein DA792_21320 (plasmid) [Celeribacter baekdonensis]|uniref:Uncharacterized protein n=1 Tax=Celeribacter baekdonensis TaxID=875171 RepID=A0A2R4M8Q9_9RHOB|nr:hypothetical protein DA792_21320 [Celeribacter baekdonensis]
MAGGLLLSSVRALVKRRYAKGNTAQAPPRFAIFGAFLPIHSAKMSRHAINRQLFVVAFGIDRLSSRKDAPLGFAQV